MTLLSNNDLVSVPVITYNSSAYIIDGLESIKAQTYKNIELIISDDCSTDNTVEICRQWLEKNKDRFARTLLITSDKNTGVAGNCNRSISFCQGEWIKMLSGDDLFMPNTIEGYIRFIGNHPECEICFAKLKFYGDDENEVRLAKLMYEQWFYPIIQSDLSFQQKNIIKKLFIPGPGIFYKKKLWSEVQGFDERYQFAEEHPFFYKVLKQGHRIFFINTELYKYHIGTSALKREKGKMNIRVLRDSYHFFRDVRSKELLKRGNILWLINDWANLYYELNENTLIAKVIKHASPINLVHWTKKRIKG